MVTEKIIRRVFGAGNHISTDRSRCLRMRYNRSPCARCGDCCRVNAIAINEDVVIDANQCSECMLCVSSCPSDCFSIRDFDFYSLIGSLQTISSSVGPPVLGCRLNASDCVHEKTFCFGFLSEEHLIALSVFLSDHLQLDISGCAACRNSFIIDTLEERIRAIEAKTSIRAADKVRLIRNVKELDYRAIAYDRRAFFKTFGYFAKRRTAELFCDETKDKAVRKYSAKTAPIKKELLNRAQQSLPGEIQRTLLNNYYYSVTVADTCDDCSACVGMCPTGALKIESNGDARDLFFSASRCSGCGLCESFCMSDSIALVNGSSGDNSLEFVLVKHKS